MREFHFSNHLFCGVESDLANSRDEIHLDESHRTSEALLKSNQIDLCISEITLPKNERGDQESARVTNVDLKGDYELTFALR